MNPLAARYVLAALVLLLYASLCAGLYWREYRRKLESDLARRAMRDAVGGNAAIAVVYASQTGFAEQIAWQTAKALQARGAQPRMLSLGELDGESLAGLERALFVLSTYGEGDPPDAASVFVRKVMASPLDLSRLRFGLLALGDAGYVNFCGFGRAVGEWLKAQGAQPMFERIELDNADPEALRRWRVKVEQLAELAGGGPISDASSHKAWDAPAFERWTLSRREHLNPGSAGHPLYHLELIPPGAMPQWEAGDLGQVKVPFDPARPRDYSIASLPADGSMHLVVRREIRADGSVGAGSGWLTGSLTPGDTVEIRLKPNRNFHLGENVARPLILVGNGTGLAGLRGLLKARAAAGQHMNWLVFGERNAAHDSLYADELETWFSNGHLAHLDRAFSRDRLDGRYVQDVLESESVRVRAWVEQGAAIYVCGSLEGMAAGVDRVLEAALGRAALDRLTDAGRYRRDVY
jgi:sulfite reductase (NADPH) flavoprotein alpha-component